MKNTNVIDTFELDALNWDDDFELPPGRAADLIRPMNRHQCCQAKVVQLERGTWFLRWKERHPEMLPRFEYVTGEDSDEAKERYYGKKIMSMLDDSYEAEAWKEPDIAEREAEYMELLRELPFKDCELPLTRQEACILVVAVWMPAFLPEIAKHDK